MARQIGKNAAKPGCDKPLRDRKPRVFLASFASETRTSVPFIVPLMIQFPTSFRKLLAQVFPTLTGPVGGVGLHRRHGTLSPSRL